MIVDENENIINKNPDIKYLISLEPFKSPRSYTGTDNCPKVGKNGEICQRPLYGNAKRERDKNGKSTGRWICSRCYSIDYNNFYIKPKRMCRTGRLSPDFTTAKGIKFQKLACIQYGWEDLNIKDDNFNSSIDCFDPIKGTFYQVKGRKYNHREKFWHFAPLDREWDKIYEYMICYCCDKDMKTIERIYKFPCYEIEGRKSITIDMNPSRGGQWYEKYRIKDEKELKKANYIFHSLMSR